MGGRRIGYGQATLMVMGFVPVMGFLLWLMYCAFRALKSGVADPDEYAAQYRPYAWIGYTGAALCIVAWGWALLSSMEMVREARDSETTPPTPPKLPDRSP